MIKTDAVVIEKNYPVSPDKVWDAITDKDQMREWYFELDEFRAEPGFKFNFYGKGKEGETYLHLCEVTEVVPGQKLTYSWRYDGFEGISFVTFELFAEGNGTKLRLTHLGLESFPGKSAFAKENFVEGWTYLLKTSLENYLNKP